MSLQVSSAPSSPQSSRSITSTLGSSEQALGKILAKRARMTSKADLTLLDTSTPSSKCVTPKMRHNASVEDCVELCRLLLQKVGANAKLNDTAELDRVLTNKYPPGVADILGRITGALDTEGTLDSVSDITDSSDDEFVPLPKSVRAAAQEKTVKTASAPKVEYKAETKIIISRIHDFVPLPNGIPAAAQEDLRQSSISNLMKERKSQSLPNYLSTCKKEHRIINMYIP